MKVRDRTELDHMPLEIILYGTREKRKKKRRRERNRKERMEEEMREKYLRRCEEWTSSKEECGEL